MDKTKEEIISQSLLDILVCPVCKTDVELVEYKKGSHGLKCATCNNTYPIREGIPVMLIDEAIKG